MDPSWVVLDRSVSLIARTGEKTTRGAGTSEFDTETWDVIEDEEAGVVLDNAIEEKKPMGVVDWVQDGLVRFVPELTKAPKISTISLLLPATPREIRAQLESVTVACADKNLLVLFTAPDSPYHASSGRYLVYDAEADTFIAPPRIDLEQFREVFGYVPAIVHLGQGGNFTLAVVVQSHLSSQYSVLLWSPSTDQERWVQRNVNFPSEVLHYSKIDLSFAFEESWACWVDLYFGIVAFNVVSDQLKFLPLPEPYVREWPPMPRMSPTVHSTMGCVDGVIKFLSMDGYDDDDCPKDRINITSWTLQEKWSNDGDLLMANLWADSTFVAIPDLQQQVPMCPVLSLKEPNMVSFFFSDIGYVDGHVATKGEYVLSLNMKSKKIQSWSICPPGRSLEFIPRVIATDFCAYKHWSCMDYQGNVTSSKREGACHSSSRAPRKQKK